MPQTRWGSIGLPQSVALTGSSTLTFALSGALSGGDEYGVADAIAGAPFTITAPTEPTITSSASVTTATIAANKVNGRRITLASGSYGSQTFTTDDQEIILQSGATIQITLDNAARIKIRGENARDGTITQLDIQNTSDVYVYECTITDTGEEFNWVWTNSASTARVAYISCYVEMGSYAFYVDNGTTDVIFGNCEIISTGGFGDPTMRFMSASRCVTRECRIVISGGPQAHRIHANTGEGDSFDHWVEGNQIEGSTGQMQPDSTGGGSTQALENIWYQNNNIYMGASGNWGSMGDPGERAENLNMTGNVLNSTGGVFPSELEASWDISGNTVNATTTAPAWDFQ